MGWKKIITVLLEITFVTFLRQDVTFSSQHHTIVNERIYQYYIITKEIE
jgi:hypothetical protein